MLGEILLNQPEIQLYLPFSNWFVTKLHYVWFQINWKIVNTIWFRFNLKKFSVCTVNQFLKGNWISRLLGFMLMIKYLFAPADFFYNFLTHFYNRTHHDCNNNLWFDLERKEIYFVPIQTENCKVCKSRFVLWTKGHLPLE